MSTDYLTIINCILAGLCLIDSIVHTVLLNTCAGNSLLEVANIKIENLKHPLWFKLLRIYCLTLLIIYCIQ